MDVLFLVWGVCFISPECHETARGEEEEDDVRG